MKVYTKEEAQKLADEWGQTLECLGKQLPAVYGNRKVCELPFSVDYDGLLEPKKPWHYPRPDDATPIDAKVWCTGAISGTWYKRHYAGNGKVWANGETSFTTSVSGFTENIALADPENLNVSPPEGWGENEALQDS